MDYKQQYWINLQQWYRKPLGMQFADAEIATLARLLPELFGYHILCVGHPSENDLLAPSPIARQYYLDPVSPPNHAVASFLADPQQLPVANDSIDVTVAAHVLEFEHHPDQVLRTLRELERVLIAEGRLIILGFNPFSTWGLWRLLCPHYAREAGWGGHFCSVIRLQKILAELGFDIISIQYHFFRPPVASLSLLNKFAFMDYLGVAGCAAVGAGYALLAKKRVSTLTPVKPRWRPQRSLPAEGVVNRTLRRKGCGSSDEGG